MWDEWNSKFKFRKCDYYYYGLSQCMILIVGVQIGRKHHLLQANCVSFKN